MIPVDKNGKAILPRAEVRLAGKAERVTPEGIFVRVAPGLMVYIPPAALEVVADA